MTRGNVTPGRDADEPALPPWLRWYVAAHGPLHHASPRASGNVKVNAAACWPYMRSISM